MNNLLSCKTTKTLVYRFNRETQQELENLKEAQEKQGNLQYE